MKVILSKFTSVIGTLILVAVLFTTFAVGSLAASEEAPQTGEISISWASGFMVNETRKTYAELSELDSASLNFFSRSQSGFCISDVITVTKAGTTLQVTVPGVYSSVNFFAVCGLSDVWECKTTADLFVHPTIREKYHEENFAFDLTKTGAERFTGPFILGNENNVRGFSRVSTADGIIYTYTTQRDNEHIVFSGQNANNAKDLAAAPYSTLTYSYSGEGTTQVYTTEKPAEIPEIPDTPSLDTSAADSLNAEQLAMLSEALSRYSVTDQTTFDALCAAASAFSYEGIAARVQTGVGVRSLYRVSHGTLASHSADRVAYGAIMGIGSLKGISYNTTDSLTVKADTDAGYVAENDYAKAVVVYALPIFGVSA